MSFVIGLDSVTENPRVYLKTPDGKIYFFDDAREANHVGIELINASRFFIHRRLFDQMPDRDREILK